MFTKLLISLLFLLPLFEESPQQAYVEKYAAIAVEEMFRSGVPASITLAQGMLESRYGLSDLALKGNNHFGIKCHSDWTGRTMKVDDDRKGECFRVYSDVSQSFRDHSDFLRYRPRYQFLFDFPVTDYESWAYGLSKAGYATDPSYPQKLIRLIREYDLSRFDSLTSSRAEDSTLEDQPSIPVPPSVLETPETLLEEDFSFSLTRKIYRLNGVRFVYSVEGESYGSIAGTYNLFKKEILRYNDAVGDSELLPGTAVYIDLKKKHSVKGMEKYIVEEDGESLRDIAQRFAVRESALMKLNKFSKGHSLREGDTIKLR